MAIIQKRPDGVYRARYRDAGGRSTHGTSIGRLTLGSGSTALRPQSCAVTTWTRKQPG